MRTLAAIFLRRSSLLGATAMLWLATLAPAVGGAEAAVAHPRLTGTPLLRVWRAEDYGASLFNTRLFIHPDGPVYVANDDGVLEFDGEHWRLIPMPREGAARAFALDAAGVLWVFGHDDIAQLQRDARGELRTVSRLELLPPEERAVGTVNRTVVTADGIYARGQRRLMLFRPDGRVQTWSGANPAGLLWTIEKEVFADHDQFVRVSPDGLTPVSLGPPDQAPKAADVRVFATAPAGDRAGEWLLLTVRGPVRWRGPGTPFKPLAAESSTPFASDLASAGAFLADGRLALGTERSGLFIFERNGRLSQHLDRRHGLPGNRIHDLAVDADGGLWLAFQEGLARLDLDSPFAIHGPPQGLVSNARRFASWRDQLYVATSEGVARRDPSTGNFVSIAGFQVGSNRPLVVGDRLVAATRGLREITADDQSRSWIPDLVGPIVAATGSPGAIHAGSSAGLSLIRPNATTGGWETAGRSTSLTLGVDELLDRGDGWLWAVTRGGDVARLDFRAGVRLDAPIHQFSPADGLPEAGRNDHLQLLSVRDDLIVVAADWLRRFEPAANRFVPETRFTVAGAPVRGARLAGRSATGGAWLRPADHPGRLLRAEPAADGTWQLTEHSLAPLRGAAFDSLFEETSTQTLWLAGQGILVSLDLSWQPRRTPAPPRVAIRRIESEDGQLIATGGPRTRPLTLIAAQNALRITYAAPAFGADYRGRAQTLYRTQFEGIDRGWSAWTTETRRDFTNLPPGALRFRVQARIPGRPDGAETTLAFTLAAPWWRTSWAILAYLAATGGVIYAGFKFRLRTLRRRNEQLEAIVTARTQQLARLNDELTDAVSIVAHDLRGPVSGIRSLARQLRATPHIWASSEGPEFLGEIERTSGAAVDMMARLLDLQRASDRAAGLTLAPVDVGTLVNDTARQLAAAANTKRIALTVNAPTVPRLTDAESVTSIVANLVSNALKFLPADGRGAVNITLSGDKRSCRLVVADNGPGVPPAERATLFEKFTHGTARPTAGEASTGLGLFIVQKLVTALGGTIEVFETPGGGATFVVVWPAALAAISPPA